MVTRGQDESGAPETPQAILTKALHVFGMGSHSPAAPLKRALALGAAGLRSRPRCRQRQPQGGAWLPSGDPPP